MFGHIGQEKLFSKLDLKYGFHEIGVRSTDMQKPLPRPSKVIKKFFVMPVGLRNASASSQTLMSAIFNACIDHVPLVYLDDLLVYR